MDLGELADPVMMVPALAGAACPVCGRADRSESKGQLNGGYAWWHCEGCDLRFSSPMRGGDSSYYRSIWHYASAACQYRRKRLNGIRRTWEYRTVLEHEPMSCGRLLDIGCGAGEFLYLARERYGYQVAGLDFNQELVHAAHTAYGLKDVVCGSWPESAGPLEQGAFDRVTMFHIVEHVPDPVGAIRMAALALKPGGLLAVAVPTVHRWPPLFVGTLDLPPYHLTLWSESALTGALEAAGLETTWVGRRPLLANDFLVFSQDRFPLLQQATLSRLLWLLGRRFLVLPVFVLRATRSTTGCAIVGIGRKAALGRVAAALP